MSLVSKNLTKRILIDRQGLAGFSVVNRNSRDKSERVDILDFEHYYHTVGILIYSFVQVMLDPVHNSIAWWRRSPHDRHGTSKPGTDLRLADVSLRRHAPA